MYWRDQLATMTVGDPVWITEYTRVNKTRSKPYSKLEPVEGIVYTNDRGKKDIKYQAEGYHRDIAVFKTKEEAIAHYNGLVQQHYDDMLKTADKIKKYLITE